MSYDLSFWKYKSKSSKAHQKTYEALSNGDELTTVEILPIEEMKQRVASLFSVGWTRLDDLTWESTSSEGGSFQLFTMPQFFRVDCHRMKGDDLNRFIDVGAEFDCPLYDPQENQRYQLPTKG